MDYNYTCVNITETFKNAKRDKIIPALDEFLDETIKEEDYINYTDKLLDFTKKLTETYNNLNDDEITGNPDISLVIK